jgi:hypothetical protein
MFLFFSHKSYTILFPSLFKIITKQYEFMHYKKYELYTCMHKILTNTILISHT